jgi:hypothetical protein
MAGHDTRFAYVTYSQAGYQLLTLSSTDLCTLSTQLPSTCHGCTRQFKGRPCPLKNKHSDLTFKPLLSVGLPSAKILPKPTVVSSQMDLQNSFAQLEVLSLSDEDEDEDGAVAA